MLILPKSQYFDKKETDSSNGLFVISAILLLFSKSILEPDWKGAFYSYLPLSLQNSEKPVARIWNIKILLYSQQFDMKH